MQASYYFLFRYIFLLEKQSGQDLSSIRDAIILEQEHFSMLYYGVS